MNEAAANALYEAERKGVRQIKGAMFNAFGGMCALGALARAGIGLESMTQHAVTSCPLCAGDLETLGVKTNQCGLIAHFNDHHDMTFSEIARKLGPDAA